MEDIEQIIKELILHGEYYITANQSIHSINDESYYFNYKGHSFYLFPNIDELKKFLLNEDKAIFIHFNSEYHLNIHLNREGII